MIYLVGALVGVVWLWFWLRGGWFPALIAALPLALAWWVIPERAHGHYPERWVTLIVFAGPWVPMVARPAIRRVMADVRTVVGTDAKFSESLSLEMRDR